MKNDYSLELDKWKSLASDPFTLLIGIDVSRLKHDACFGVKKKVLCRKFQFSNDLKGFKELSEKINLICAGNKIENILLGMEPTSIYWYALSEYLKSKGHTTCLLDPVSVFHNRKTLKKDSGKSDIKDAFAILDLMFQEKFYFTVDRTIRHFSAKLVLKNWMNTQGSIVCAKTRIRSLLSLIFPELESEVSEVATQKFLSFLIKYPTPSTILKLSESCFIKESLSELKYYNAIDLKRIYHLAKESIGVSLYDEMDSLIVRKHSENLRSLLDEEKAWFKYNYNIASSDDGCKRIKCIKGLGDKIAAGLILSIGNYELFSNATQITKLAGLNLVDKTSGSSVNKLSHISHHGNNNLRYWAYHGALHVIKHPGVFQDLYERKKKNSPGNGSGKRALIAVSDKLVRVVWAILKKGGEYDIDHDKKK